VTFGSSKEQVPSFTFKFWARKIDRCPLPLRTVTFSLMYSEESGRSKFRVPSNLNSIRGLRSSRPPTGHAVLQRWQRHFCIHECNINAFNYDDDSRGEIERAVHFCNPAAPHFPTSRLPWRSKRCTFVSLARQGYRFLESHRFSKS